MIETATTTTAIDPVDDPLEDMGTRQKQINIDLQEEGTIQMQAGGDETIEKSLLE